MSTSLNLDGAMPLTQVLQKCLTKIMKLILLFLFFSKLRAETVKWIRMIMGCKNNELQGIGDRQI